jgi:hypothetical protein
VGDCRLQQKICFFLKLKIIIFKNVLFVPKLGYNLLSVPSIVQKNMSVNFDKSGCKIQQSGQTILKAAKFGDLYVLNPNKIPSALY